MHLICLTLLSMFLSPSRTILGLSSVTVSSLDDTLVQCAADSTNLSLISDPPHLNTQLPCAAFQPMAPC